MSTLKTTYIQHPSAVSPAIELTAGGALSLDASAITTGKIDQARLPMKKIAAFTASGTWTVPAGVTYAIAHMVGGGGSSGRTGASDGSASSVAFASGTVTATGGLLANHDSNYAAIPRARAGSANSGEGATYGGQNSSTDGTLGTFMVLAGSGARIVAAAAVTPAASVTVTVGAGGAAGTGGAAGGSGYVYIEYHE